MKGAVYGEFNILQDTSTDLFDNKFSSSGFLGGNSRGALDRWSRASGFSHYGKTALGSGSVNIQSLAADGEFVYTLARGELVRISLASPPASAIVSSSR